jgi:hypothetical protein
MPPACANESMPHGVAWYIADLYTRNGSLLQLSCLTESGPIHPVVLVNLVRLSGLSECVRFSLDVQVTWRFLSDSGGAVRSQ